MFLKVDPDVTTVIAFGRRYPARGGAFLIDDRDRELFEAFREADDVSTEAQAELHRLGNWPADEPVRILADAVAELGEAENPEDDETADGESVPESAEADAADAAAEADEVEDELKQPARKPRVKR
jgi:hypothetical protein